MDFLLIIIRALDVILDILQWIVFAWVILSWILFFLRNSKFRWRHRQFYGVLEMLNDLFERSQAQVPVYLAALAASFHPEKLATSTNMLPRMSLIVCTSETGWSLSTSQTALRTAAAEVTGSPSVLTTRWRGAKKPACAYVKYICGFGSAASSNCRTSFTTPTTSHQWVGSFGLPGLTRLPTALWPGQ